MATTTTTTTTTSKLIASTVTVQLLPILLTATLSRYSLRLHVFDRKPRWTSSLIVQGVGMGLGDSRRPAADTRRVFVDPFDLRLRPLRAAPIAAEPILRTLMRDLVIAMPVPAASLVQALASSLSLDDYALDGVATSGRTALYAAPDGPPDASLGRSLPESFAFNMFATQSRTLPNLIATPAVQFSIEADLLVVGQDVIQATSLDVDSTAPLPLVVAAATAAMSANSSSPLVPGHLLATWRFDLSIVPGFFELALTLDATFQVKNSMTNVDSSEAPCIETDFQRWVLSAMNMTRNGTIDQSASGPTCRFQSDPNSVTYNSFASYYSSMLLRPPTELVGAFGPTAATEYQLWSQPLWLQFRIVDTTAGAFPGAMTWRSGFWFDAMQRTSQPDAQPIDTFVSHEFSPKVPDLGFIANATIEVQLLGTAPSAACEGQLRILAFGLNASTTESAGVGAAAPQSCTLDSSPVAVNSICSSVRLLASGVAAVAHVDSEVLHLWPQSLLLTHPLLNDQLGPTCGVAAVVSSVGVTCATAGIQPTVAGASRLLHCDATVTPPSTLAEVTWFATSPVTTGAFSASGWLCAISACSPRAESAGGPCLTCTSSITFNVPPSAPIGAFTHQHALTLRIATGNQTGPLWPLAFQ